MYIADDLCLCRVCGARYPPDDGKPATIFDCWDCDDAITHIRLADTSLSLYDARKLLVAAVVESDHPPRDNESTWAAQSRRSLAVLHTMRRVEVAALPTY